MTRFALAGVMAGAMLFASAALAQEDEAARAARWTELAHDIFGAKQIQSGDAKMTLEAPDRAEDAALVPVTISLQNPKDVKSIYLVIDDNPAPIAAHVTFGPAGDPQSLKKASGGCSAPSGS